MASGVMVRDSPGFLCSEESEYPLEVPFVDQEVPLRKHSDEEEDAECVLARSDGEEKVEGEEGKMPWDELGDIALELESVAEAVEMENNGVCSEDKRFTVIEDDAVCVDVASKAKTKNAPNANTYAAKKTVAQGMMDIALITSNANQLRYLLQFGTHDAALFRFNVVLIIISILLQIAIGVTLIFKGRADLSGDHKLEHANKLNNYVVGGVFLVTIINVFVSAFSIGPAPHVELGSDPLPNGTD